MEVLLDVNSCEQMGKDKTTNLNMLCVFLTHFPVQRSRKKKVWSKHKPGELAGLFINIALDASVS